MEIRRVLQFAESLMTEVRDHPWEAWRPVDAAEALGYEPPFRPEWEAHRAADQGCRVGDVALPFQPVSFRDFMLWEPHYRGAARGLVRRFRPRLSAAVEVYERVTRRGFPAFRPPRLWYQQPIYYMSNPHTFIPSGVTVDVPSYTTALDYELELGLVVMTPLKNATPAQAERAIGALVVLNDFSARDVQMPEQASGFGPQKAKHFLSSLSATAVTPESVLPDWQSLTATVTINGQVVSRPSPAGSQWALGDLLAHASAEEQLQPGELFGTGTFVGGSGVETGNWLHPGDTLRLSIDGVGAIEHRVRLH